ncbi:MAG: Crp/Fnr family transcriptional regulator [Hyphomonadaceae bacterium]|nr:Crp/Fnr family transcriptional regulator [Hyphomonadaceae bacterium]
MAVASRSDLEGVEAALARAPLFRSMSAEGLKRLAAAGSTLNLEAGARLCAKGEPGEAAFVVLEGEVEVSLSTEGGRDVRLAALGPGAVIGEMASIDGGPRSADMAATRRTRLVRIPREAMVTAMRTEPEALFDLVIELCQRLRGADGVIEDSAILDLGGRLARLLLTEAKSGAVISLTQVEMARRIGASREKVNRKLHEWREAGWISLGKSGVRLERRGQLEALIESLRAR